MGGGGSSKQEPTQAEIDYSNVNAEQWNDYQTRFVPFENKYIEDVTADPTFKEDVVGGRVNADLAGQNNGAIPVGKINQIGSVVSSDYIPKMAAAGAAAGANAKSTVRDSQVQGMMSAVNMGRGQAAGAIDGMGSIAADASRMAENSAEAAFNNDSSTMSAIGSGVGAIAGVAGNSLKNKP